MNIKDFINYIITFDNIYDILNNCKTQSEKGFIFERLYDIIIKFGFCDLFFNYNFNHLIGNSNNGKLKLLNNFYKYLNKKVFSGNSSGCSDITLQNKHNNTYIFISCKYPKINENLFDDNIKQKSVDYNDIQNIIAMANKNKDIYKNYEIYLIVPNKQKILEKVKNANKSSKYITEYMIKENILDENDLNMYFLNFKKDIIKNKNEDWNNIYLNSKENLTLRFHQELITQKTCDLIKNNKSFLWGCKCRSGKTYMLGGLIVKQLKIKNKLNVLIITPAPTETIPQFTNDLFNKFNDFNKFKIHHIENSKILDCIEINDNNIFIISKQLLQKYINENTILKIKNLKLDIIGFDENHFSGTTNLSKEILDSYSSKNTIRIYLTATYNKPLKEWNIPSNCQLFWDIEDEQICKELYKTIELKKKSFSTKQICKSILNDDSNLNKLKEKHGFEYIDDIINCNLSETFKYYENMPDLHLITNLFDQQRYEEIKKKINNENKFGFCFDSLFGLNQNKNQFSFENEVKLILRYISGSNKEEDGDKTIFTRINYICSEKESRIPFTQIWFLPSTNINEISICLKKLMLENSLLKKYDILCINSKNKELAKDIKDEINKKEIEAKNKNKLGLIILAGNMLTLGITLNLCDLVILMNNTLSSDKVMQQMYRCMTEFVPNSIREGKPMTESKNKKFGFVVDLNISRVLNTCINYTIYKNENTIDDKINYLIKNNLINIDIDMLFNKKINSDVIIKKLMDIWKKDPLNNFKILLKNLDNDYVMFDTPTQKLLNASFINSLKDEKVNLQLKLKDENDEIQDLPKGKEIIKETKHLDNQKNISFIKDILPYVIPLTCILTIKSSNMDFVKMLNDIKNNPELLDIFDDQCLIWWNKKDLLDLIKDIINKYFDKNSNTYNVSIQFKLSLQSLLDKPKELLELINDCLKPKAIEKKQFGEVFTPIDLINEMLDKLPQEIWKNKNLKWLDPASGMGNFSIIIYLRLMENLKSNIKDIEKRRKHILENMLYMNEINKKNILICKQIFDINNEYKLNLYEGDSLKMNYDKQFDIIIGNPPYQDAKAKGDNKLYLDFIKLSMQILKSNGLLLFITPINVKNYLTCQNKNRNYIDNLYNIKFLSINTSNIYFPNIGSFFAYFLIEKKIVNETNTNVIFLRNNKIEKNVITIKKGYNLPLCMNLHDINIINKVSNLIENKNSLFDIKKALYNVNDKLIHQRIRKQHLNSEKILNKETNNFKYKIIDKINKSNPYPGIYYYNNIKMCDYGKPKIIMCTGGYLMPEYDEKGEYNLSDNMIYLICESKQNYNAFKIIINSKLINYLNKITMTDNIHGRDTVIMNLKLIDLNKINDEKDIYEIYNITLDEKKIIDLTIKN